MLRNSVIILLIIGLLSLPSYGGVVVRCLGELQVVRVSEKPPWMTAKLVHSKNFIDSPAVIDYSIPSAYAEGGGLHAYLLWDDAARTGTFCKALSGYDPFGPLGFCETMICNAPGSE